MLVSLIERASVAVGQLDARISASSVQNSWLERASWGGFAEARRAQGAEIDEIDIFSLASGVSVPGRRPIAFAADEAKALDAWQTQLRSRETRHWRDLVRYPVDLPDGWRERPALLRILELTGRTARDDRTQAPWLIGPMLFTCLGLTRRPLPCLVVADKALRFAPRDRDAIVPRFLKCVIRQADTGIARLAAMEAHRLRAAAVIEAAERPGKLIGLAALLERRPLVSPLQVAAALKLTISGAGKLVSKAAKAGLVVEISGRQAWKLYLTPDLAMAFGYVSRSIGRPPALPAPEPLDPILRRFDAELAAIDVQLAKLGIEA